MRLCVRVCLDGLSKLFIYGCLETVRQAALSPPPTPLWMRKEESLYVVRALQSLPPMAKTCQCAASSLEPLHN